MVGRLETLSVLLNERDGKAARSRKKVNANWEISIIALRAVTSHLFQESERHPTCGYYGSAGPILLYTFAGSHLLWQPRNVRNGVEPLFHAPSVAPIIAP